MNRQVATRLIFGSLLFATFAAIPAYAQPPSPPQLFWGNATVNCQPVPVGAKIKATGLGVLTSEDNPAIEDNPVVVTVEGKYGGPKAQDHQLIVQGQVEDNTPLEFFIIIDGNEMKAQCAAVQQKVQGPWQSSYPFNAMQLVMVELNLRVGECDVAPGSSTATATSTRAPSKTESAESAQATATRQTPQAAGGTQQPASATTAPSPVSAAAQAASATAQRMVVVATPTSPAAPVVAETPSAMPTLQLTDTPSPSATPEPALPTELPTLTLTPAVVAQAPRATSNPIIGPETPSPAGQSPAQSAPVSSSTDTASGRTLALWGGLAALAVAAAAGAIIWIRAHPR